MKTQQLSIKKIINSAFIVLLLCSLFFCNKIDPPEKFIFEDIHKIPYDGGPAKISISKPTEEDINLSLSLNALSALGLDQFLYPIDVSDAAKKRANLQKQADKYEEFTIKLNDKPSKDYDILKQSGGGIDQEVLSYWKNSPGDQNFNTIRSTISTILASIRAQNTILEGKEGEYCLKYLKDFFTYNNADASPKTILEYIFKRLGIKKFYTFVKEDKKDETNVKITNLDYFLNLENVGNSISKRIENTLKKSNQKLYLLPKIQNNHMLMISTKSSVNLDIFNVKVKKDYVIKISEDQYFSLKFFVLNDTFYINLQEKGWMKSKVNEFSTKVTQEEIKSKLKEFKDKEMLLFYEKN